MHFPAPELDLDELFLFETERRVQKDRTISLNGVIYEVDAALIGEKVTLRFDPGAAPDRPVQVCHKGKLIEQAKPVQLYANCFVKRDRPSWTLNSDEPAPEPSPSGMKLCDLPDNTKEVD